MYPNKCLNKLLYGMFSLGVKSVVIEGLKNEFRLKSILDSHHKHHP